MPRHQQVATCRRSNGPVSKFCTCEHCTLCVCSVCGAYEGGLTTDCPGVPVDFDRQQEVYETLLDYTDDRGWHQGEPMKRRAPRFAATRLPPEPPRADPRAAIAPTVDWALVDRAAALQHELAQKAIAWVVAERNCEERTAAFVRTQEEAAPLRDKTVLDEKDRDLLAKLERDQIDFRLADERAQKCENELRQEARRLVAALEGDPATRHAPASL